VEGTVSKTTSGYIFTGIVIRPGLTIADEDGENLALALLNKAKGLCLVSRALATMQEFVPQVEISKMAFVGCASVPAS
jgi:organic hydroperoxide reductase OsmC/OhrA